MMVSRKKILIIAIVAVVAVVAAGIYLWQSLSPSFAEAENTIKSFIAALNDYDLDASWALMSPDLQASYGSSARFNSIILSGFKQSEWEASLTNISSRSIETVNGVSTARLVCTLQITERGMNAYSETYTFRLVKIGDQWKINDWLVEE